MVRGRRGVRAAVAGVALALVLTGCSTHVNAGSAGVDKAEQALSRIDGVQSVRGNGQNSLPFAGTVSAFVTTDDDPSDEQLQRVTDEVGRWVGRTSNASVSYGAHIETDGIGDPSPEVSAYWQVVAKHTVTGASVEPGRIHVHVADAADIADATAVIEQAAPDTAAVVDGGASDTD